MSYIQEILTREFDVNMINAVNPAAPDRAPSKNPYGFLEDLRSSPVSSLMIFDKREFFQTPSATSPMRCGILQSILAVATIDSPQWTIS
jgi:hypothetical protein